MKLICCFFPENNAVLKCSKRIDTHVTLWCHQPWLANPQTEWRFLARRITDFYGPWLPACAMELMTPEVILRDSPLEIVLPRDGSSVHLSPRSLPKENDGRTGNGQH